jgi:hypothetical protein
VIGVFEKFCENLEYHEARSRVMFAITRLNVRLQGTYWASLGVRSLLGGRDTNFVLKLFTMHLSVSSHM